MTPLMLCSQMIANENPASAYGSSSQFSRESQFPNHKSRASYSLRTLFTLLHREISRNSSEIKRLRSLTKITGGCAPSSFQLSTFHRQLRLTPLESAFTPNAPVSPLESAFTKNNRG